MRDWRQHTVETLKDLDLWAKKSKGQNFLIRYRVVKQIVDSVTPAITPNDHILEIGGGLGILTEALISTGAKVTIIEKEEKLAKYLEELHMDNNQVNVINSDALLHNWSSITTDDDQTMRVVANLPYSISSPIIEKIFHEDKITSATIMLQKEVALRCLAKPGSDDYSRLSTICRIHATSKRIMDITPDAFFPVPKVNSAVISLWKKKPELQNSHEELELLIRNLFSLKRRIVRSVVRGFLKRKDVEDKIWDECPHNQTRIFELSIAELDEILIHLKKHDVFPLA